MERERETNVEVKMPLIQVKVMSPEDKNGKIPLQRIQVAMHGKNGHVRECYKTLLGDVEHYLAARTE